MIKSYLMIAWRNFGKDKVSAFINLVGLVIGLVSVMLISSYVFYELSFDRHFSNAERIYQVIFEPDTTNPAQTTASVPEPLGKTLQQEFNEVEASTILHSYEATYTISNKPVSLNVLSVNPGFFDMFDLPFDKGNKDALQKGENVIITEQTAKKLFWGQQALGKIISQKFLDGSIRFYTIAAIIHNIPPNTHFYADIITSKRVTAENLDFLGYKARPQFVMLRNGTDAQKLQAKLSRSLRKFNLGQKAQVDLLPLADVHLRSAKIPRLNVRTGEIRYLYIIASAAMLILLVGCVNYVNLSTAYSLQRVKEIGIRKTLGSSRRQLAFQFLGESLLIFTAATLLAISVSAVLWPMFSNFLQLSLSVSALFSWQNGLIFGLLSLVSGLIAGLYPALFVSRMHPAGILQNHDLGPTINFGPRKALIVFQFSVSIVLVVATVIVWQQLELFKNRPLGFRPELLLVLPPMSLEQQEGAFKKSLLDHPQIGATSFVDMNLGEKVRNTATMTDPLQPDKRLDIGFIDADLHFIQTLGIQLKEGRNYSANTVSDGLNYDSLASKVSPERSAAITSSRPLIITESLAKALKLRKPVNTVLNTAVLQGTVIGVIGDFQVTSLKQVSPLLVYTYRPKPFVSSTFIRISNQNIPQSIQHIQNTFNDFFPDHEFRYSFADASLQKMYESEHRLGSLFGLFAGLAITLSCLGLFSLTALVVRLRTKEIAIRKVMGASVAGIAILLFSDFAWLMLAAGIIAIPIAWYGMDQWLQDFAHRVSIYWAIFLIAMLLSLLTGLLTVGFQTLKAALVNPVESLKKE